jgi:hypothetical protein
VTSRTSHDPRLSSRASTVRTQLIVHAPVPAYRFRQQRTLSGNQTGTQTADLWFAQKDGLPLRNRRDVTVHTDTIVGSSSYTEHGSFQLTSLQPQRRPPSLDVAQRPRDVHRP